MCCMYLHQFCSTCVLDAVDIMNSVLEMRARVCPFMRNVGGSHTSDLGALRL
jgi:hypothetical protein